MSSFQVLFIIFSASSAQRDLKSFQGKLSATVKPQQKNKKFGSNLKDYEDYGDYYDYYDYYYDDPLPSGPTRRPPATEAKSQKQLRFPGKKSNIIKNITKKAKHKHTINFFAEFQKIFADLLNLVVLT